ncbi:S-adenosylmethionine decarboxylase [Deinococcus yavapaiensis]|uniref:S-adenosylmethionine decarboxylase n=1 Tax=Deinococcus yavapaiensis KR-236 TaxID=694435 RepID=A0A318SHP5_9DEIO|nr:S-adenosylmethionine decarboxylase [Deinococcus yavapaiensis]PYE56665.1 S-adenosylmethionine decarboxylase [Deinococcus yavapaiensis KR-236]
MTGFAEYGLAEGGRWVAEIYGCDYDTIENAEHVEAAMRDAVISLGAVPETVHSVFHKFQPQGLSGTVMSPVALVTIHTWPEDNASATLDLYFYRGDANPEQVIRELTTALGASDQDHYHLWRGARRTRGPSGQLVEEPHSNP